MLGSVLWERLWGLGDSKPSLSQMYNLAANVANNISCWMNRSTATRLWVIITLYLAHVRPCLQKSAQFGASQSKKHIHKPELSRMTERQSRMENLPCEERLNIQLGARTVWRHITALCGCLQGDYGGDGPRLFTRCVKSKWERMKVNWHKLSKEKFHVDIRRIFFPTGTSGEPVPQQWIKWPRESV